MTKQPGNALKEWFNKALGELGQNEFARMNGFDKGWLSTKLNQGTAKPETIVRIARALGRSPIEPFKILGWLSDEDIETPEFVLDADERQLIRSLRRVPPTLRPRARANAQADFDLLADTR